MKSQNLNDRISVGEIGYALGTFLASGHIVPTAMRKWANLDEAYDYTSAVTSLFPLVALILESATYDSLIEHKYSWTIPFVTSTFSGAYEIFRYISRKNQRINN